MIRKNISIPYAIGSGISAAPHRRSAVLLAVFLLLFTACATTDELPAPPAVPCTLTVSMPAADTRGLTTTDGVTISAIWQEGDYVQVYKGSTLVGTLHPTTTGTSEATLVGGVTGTTADYPVNTTTLTLRYQPQRTTAEDYTPDGTLATILQHEAITCADITAKVSALDTQNAVVTATAQANFSPQLMPDSTGSKCIAHLTFDRPMSFVGIERTPTALASPVEVTLAQPSTEVFVTLPSASGSQTLTVIGGDENGIPYGATITTTASVAGGRYAVSTATTLLPLCIEARETNITVSVAKAYYVKSDFAGVWADKAAEETVTVTAGHRIFLGALREAIDGFPKITCSGPYNIYGSLLSMMDYEHYADGVSAGTNMSSYFLTAFDSDVNLYTPAHKRMHLIGLHMGEVTIVNRMFESMFANCVNLTTPPELALEDWNTSEIFAMNALFDSMFANCVNLTTPPELALEGWDIPKVEILSRFFQNMFKGCSRINAVTNTATADILLESRNNRYTDWLSGTAYTGTLTVKSGTMSKWEAIKAAGNIPAGWTIVEKE